MNKYKCIYLIVLINVLIISSVSASSTVNNAVYWLESNQSADGNWGEIIPSRDTPVVIETIAKIKSDSPNLFSADIWLQSQESPNNDYLARKTKALSLLGANTSALSTTLLSTQNPDGGFGIAGGYGSDTLDTLLSLGALKAAGFTGGLTVADENISSGQTDIFQFELPDNVQSLKIVITKLTGAIDFRFKPGVPPTLYDPNYHLTSAPIGLNGLPVQPGTNYIRIDSSMNSIYSFEVSYVTTNGFDTISLLKPINYLANAQNPDGGWGLIPGANSNVYLTSKVLFTLEGYSTFFDLKKNIDNGKAWLLVRQNADGGWGEEGSTIYESALAFYALKSAGVEPVYNATDYLLSNQLPDGSWNHNAYETALSVLALSMVFDITPPARITDLSYDSGTTWINWTWINPKDADYNHTVIYLNGIWKKNTSNPFYNVTGLATGTVYEIETMTVDKYGNINGAWVNGTGETQYVADTTPPASIKILGFTNGTAWINWTWINPSDSDFNHTVVYLNGTWKANISGSFFNGTGLAPATVYEIETRTVDKVGNMNASWVNSTARTASLAAIQVTNPSANPAIILNDNGRLRAPGTNITRLNVTVIGNVASVTINLSLIGGTSTSPMTRISGTDIYSITTNATSGINLTNYLVVNATGTSGNFNNSVGIPVTVLLRGDIVRDNKIDLKDLLYLRRHLAGLEPSINTFVADIQPAAGDDSVDLKDLLYLRRYLAGLETVI